MKSAGPFRWAYPYDTIKETHVGPWHLISSLSWSITFCLKDFSSCWTKSSSVENDALIFEFGKSTARAVLDPKIDSALSVTFLSSDSRHFASPSPFRYTPYRLLWSAKIRPWRMTKLSRVGTEDSRLEYRLTLADENVSWWGGVWVWVIQFRRWFVRSAEPDIANIR